MFPQFSLALSHSLYLLCYATPSKEQFVEEKDHQGISYILCISPWISHQREEKSCVVVNHSSNQIQQLEIFCVLHFFPS